MKIVLVEVKRTHIKKGKRGKSAKCPIALALQSKLKNKLWEMGVTDCWQAPGCDLIPMPKKVVRFADAFDRGKPVKPFSFRLRYEEN